MLSTAQIDAILTMRDKLALDAGRLQKTLGPLFQHQDRLQKALGPVFREEAQRLKALEPLFREEAQRLKALEPVFRQEAERLKALEPVFRQEAERLKALEPLFQREAELFAKTLHQHQEQMLRAMEMVRLPTEAAAHAQGLVLQNQGSEFGYVDERTAARYLRRFSRHRAGGPVVEAARRALR